MSNSSEILFFFDFVSPYSFLCWERIRNDQFIRDYNLILKPVTLGNVIKYYETKGPAEIEAKRNYLFKDFLRKVSRRSLKFQLPKRLPFNSSYLLRLSLNQDYKLVDDLFGAAWKEGIDVEDIEELKKYLIEKEHDFESIDELASSRESRKAIKENVKEALDNGVFGVPSFYVNGELFWGEDSVDDLKSYLQGQDLLDHKIVEAFESNYPIGR